jgi:Glyoxalase-like domain
MSRALPRLRQAVLAAHDLESVAGTLRDRLELSEPFSDPGVEYFGLRNAVFALGSTFLEVVSPVREDTAAGRLLARRGGDCGYMLMFQVGDLAAARERAAGRGVREVFGVELDDISEVHLHPGDMRGAIVSLSSPQPPDAWRWAGPGWQGRSAPLSLAGATIAVGDPGAVADRWGDVLGAPVGSAGVQLTTDPTESGLVEIVLDVTDDPRPDPFELAGVRFTFTENEERQ